MPSPRLHRTLLAAGAAALVAPASAAGAGTLSPASQPVRCGDADIVQGEGVWRAAAAYDVRSASGTAVVQAIWNGRSRVQVRVCDDRGLRGAATASVQVAIRPWRELQYDSQTCRLPDGDYATAVATRLPESARALRSRLIDSVRRAQARVIRLGDGRHVVVSDDDLPVPTSRTIGSRDWAGICD